MADIGVIHASLGADGGAEAVATQTVAALVDAGHDVTVYTTDSPSITDLNETHGTTLPASLPIKTPATVSTRAVETCTSVVSKTTHVEDLPLLRQTAFERVVERRYSDTHDLLVCTHGEFSVEDAIEYVHFPYFSAEAMQRYGPRFDEQLYPTYHRLCRALKQRDQTAATTTLTNSQWTADVVAETLGRDARVVYPPVDTDAFEPPDWDDQESGFVAVGRIHPLKRQHQLVDIIDQLRADGVETHLHIVGPSGSDTYSRRLAARAAKRSYVHVEGKLPRADLVELLEGHRYGLHGRHFEHFGIAVGEIAASGALPFVHASGGQQEVVHHTDDLCYTDVPDAVETIKQVMTSAHRQQELRDVLRSRIQEFATDRFRAEITNVISEQIP